MKSICYHPALGEITVSQSYRSRRVAISVRPSGEVRLSIPMHVSVREGIAVLDKQKKWVEEARGKMAERRVTELIEMPYATRNFTLRLNPANTLRRNSHLAGNEIIVSYPAQEHYTNPKVQAAIRRGLEKAWRVEAKEILPKRLEELARQRGLNFRSVSIRRSVTRWGSCSTSNDISLSLFLMRLPDRLIDYILLHELCHTIHKNHSKRFYDLLDRLCDGRNAELRRELKEYRILT